MTTTPGEPSPHDPDQGPTPPGYDSPTAGQGGYAASPPDHPQATLVLILGILGLVMCGVIAPVAWWMGRSALAEIDAAQGALGGRGQAQAGYVLGIIGTILLLFAVLAFVAVIGLMTSISVVRQG